MIKLCPFRVITKTEKSITQSGVTLTSQIFAPCLRHDCPAFHRREGAYGRYIENCRRLKQKEAET